MTRRRALSRGVAMGAVAVSLLAAGPANAAVPATFVLSPTSGAAGSSLFVSGAGFGRKEAVTISWDGVRYSSVRSGGNGSFSTTVVAPVLDGAHMLTAASSAASAQTGFTTDATAPPPEPTPPPGGLVIAAPIGPFTVRDGGGIQVSGEFLRNNGGGAIRRLQVQRFTGYGIANMDWWPPREPVGRTLVEDCIAEDISASPPKSMNGTGEAGFWFGNPTDARRLLARRSAWMGMWTGANCTGSVIEDFALLEMPHVGLYVEHVTKDTVFRRGRIVSQNSGINVEWWYGGSGSHDLIFEDLDIYCPAKSQWTVSGIFLDAGTYGCTIRRVRFHGPGDAIGLPTVLADPTRKNIVDEASCVFENTGRRIWTHDNGMG